MDNAVIHIIEKCAQVKPESWVVVLYDDSTVKVKDCFAHFLNGACTRLDVCKLEMKDRHGCEPPYDVQKKMIAADIIFCITKYSLAHTNARKLANKQGVKFLSMPEYSMEMLKSESILADYEAALPFVEQISDMLTLGKTIEVYTNTGTSLVMNIDSREGNCCPGFVNKKYLLGSPPDIEANIAPSEFETSGIIMVDGSITDEKLGLLRCPVKLIIEDGRIKSFESAQNEYVEILSDIFGRLNSDKAYILGECGIGLNPKAKLCGNMLVDEGTYGCIHFGFGSNWTIGGENKIDFHLDFVIKKPTLLIDGKIIMKEGEFI